MQGRLTGKLQLKALAGVLGVSDEVEPQAAGCAVQSHPQHLGAAEHSQQTGGVVGAVIDLDTGETPTQKHRRDLISKKSFSPHSPQSQSLASITTVRGAGSHQAQGRRQSGASN